MSGAGAKPTRPRQDFKTQRGQRTGVLGTPDQGVGQTKDRNESKSVPVASAELRRWNPAGERGSDELVDEVLEVLLAAALVGLHFAEGEGVFLQFGEPDLALLDVLADALIP